MPRRPQSEHELQEREATGVIRASRFVRKFARSHKPITIETICEIHKQIFATAWPDIGGVYRQENLEITGSEHLPPHFKHVPKLMHETEQELERRVTELKGVEGVLGDGNSSETEMLTALDRVVNTAAWLHHTITHIHPYREGNGRTARLAANLIFERFGLVGLSVRVEKENKTRYRRALAQIDKMHDYEPLKELMYEGLNERYEGVTVKYYPKR